MKITLKQGDYNFKNCKVGFSWTIFFFGAITLLFRGMYTHFFITIVTLGFAAFYYMFAGNKIYIKQLLEQGYVPTDDMSEKIISTL